MKVFGHRGFSGKYPENTMLAFEKAVETGCYGIELDVQLTKDNQIVIMHDEKVDRTTDGTGWIKDYTLEELKKLNASVLFPEVPVQRIPTLEEYLDYIKDTNIVTNIELKTGVIAYPDIEKMTAEMVAKYHLEDRIIYSSFSHMSVKKIQQFAPTTKTGALMCNEIIQNAGYFCKDCGFDYYHPDAKLLNDDIINDCKKYGVPLNVWTVNDMKTLQQMKDWDVEGVISNYPDICQAFAKSLEND